MSRYLNKLKPVFLLLVMSLVSLGMVFVVNQFKKEPVTTKVVAQEESVVDNSTALQVNSDTAQPQKVTEENVGIVLAETTVGSCLQSQVRISSYSVCDGRGSGEEDFKPGTRSGTLVSRNASITLVEVIVPEFLSGSEVKDSNRKITSTTPIYKPAGEQVDEKTANILLTPGKQIGEEASYVAKKPFSTPFSTLFGQKPEEPSEQGEIVIDKVIKNDCEECNNPSNSNPDKSNKISNFMKDILYRAPGQKKTVVVEDMTESCPANEVYREWVDNTREDRKACTMSPGAVAIQIVKDIPDAIWNECKGFVQKYDENGNPIPPSEDCMYVEDIIVRMSSMFGSDKECDDEGVCTNAYMNTRNKIALSPSDSSRYSDKLYYTTKCKVLVEGIVGVVTVRCAWDASYLSKERKVAEYDDLPGIETTPGKEAYSDFLIEDGSRRAGKPAVPMN